MNPITSLRFRLDTWRAVRHPAEAARSRGALIGVDVSLPPGSVVGPRVEIGAHSSFTGPATIGGAGEAIVGKWCAIGQELRVITSNHEMWGANVHLGLATTLGLPRPESDRGPVEIGHACWIGDRVTILSGARIGNGAVIGAGSVVRSAIPAFGVAVGVPARPIRARFSDEMVAELNRLAWWDWDLDRIKRNRPFFELHLDRCSIDDLRDAIND